MTILETTANIVVPTSAELIAVSSILTYDVYEVIISL